MIKALIFAVKAALIVAIAIWVAERPGMVELQWLDYTITVQMGFFLLALLAVILAAIFIYQIIKGITGFPKSWRRYKEMQAREKTLKALSKGLAAVAAGDAKAAHLQAKKARKYAREEDALPILLSAQSARLDGQEEEANRYFLELLEQKDAAFLGVRGLLQSAMDSQDLDTARRLTERALELHPKQKWILKTSYDLALQGRDWPVALDLLKRLDRAGADEPKDKNIERAAILLARGQEYLERGWVQAGLEEMKKAGKEAKDFAPATVALARLYKDQADLKGARKVIEKAARQFMHDSYVECWEEMVDPLPAHDPLAQFKHMAQLLKVAPVNARALRAAGKAALEAGLWGDAREYFERSEAIEPTAGLYRQWAELERLSTHDVEAARGWLEKAVDAPPDKCWICRKTGRVYSEWQAFVRVPEGFGERFNVLEWRVPDLRKDDILLLDQPAAVIPSLPASY